ncbi:MAG TPA: phosphate ABC transporter permease PstA [Gemmatimonadaceae bacterium]|jgi:phosphate transport system permease protein|nr:phosphate ABC transporter permease PstA [Gemmatimonadota bacterium]HNV74417.1 phosphate ABC transporter permease PstA [Gemmatimonadaceae bacterium]MBK6841326.1 phosphate ABC transporter permease PstA [Gemmatimonadota bacterium]MBK7835015.1 phosphate ABC transporter permease PstA [Gemmatimonadota bacterium]MBK8061427.1 phosphate ABC transporter permease PstA [Gemmatimonadota bacterium]
MSGPATVQPSRVTGVQVAAAQRTARSLGRRRVVNTIMLGVMYVAALVAVLPLIFILWHLAREGASSLSLDFFTKMPKPVGEEGGGMANAIVGTLVLLGIASAIGLPIGIGAGLYLAEQRGTRLANTVRFLSDVLNGLPSIVMGIFAWQFLVRPLGHFSAAAGGIALGAMMIPLVTRTTEEMIRLVPVSLREAALALGYTRWRTSLAIVLRTALPGIVTGALVAVARIAGETAPLLFTAFGNQFWSLSLDEPTSALPLQIFSYAISPYDDWHRLAWAGSMVLIGLVLVISLISRFVTRSRFGGGGD